MKKIKISLASAIMVTASLGACSLPPRAYQSEPAEAWVVDADTGQPIEGAVVLAQWEMSIDGQTLYGENYSAKIVETVTDNAGHFALAGWGPEYVCCGYMNWKDPQIFIFKPGYAGIIDNDSYARVEDDPRVRRHYWNGDKYRLKPYKGDYQGPDGADDFSRFMRFTSSEVPFGFLTNRPERCDWKKAPLFLRAISEQLREFENHGYHDLGSVIKSLMDHDSELTSRSCGSPKQFLQGLSH